eukprot:jgi/Astpho2/9257/Aster-x0390
MRLGPGVAPLHDSAKLNAPTPPAPLSNGASRHQPVTYRALLADVLNSVLAQALANPSGASMMAMFGGPVSKAAIPDYNEFVKTEDEMHLDQINRQISDYHYACADRLREDLVQIQTNAKAYNTEGKGKWGNGGVVRLAAELLVAFDAACADFNEQLDELEYQMKQDPEADASDLAERMRPKPPQLPLGFSAAIRTSEGKPQGYLEYIASCMHGEVRMDRIGAVQKHVQAHGRCRPEWGPWMSRNGEGPEQHQARLKQKFTFKR